MRQVFSLDEADGLGDPFESGLDDRLGGFDCCACCGPDGHVEHALTDGGSSGGSDSYGKPSYSWDEAARETSRHDRKWGDGDSYSSGGIGVTFSPSGLGSGGTVTYGYLGENDVGADEGGRSFRAFNAQEMAMVERAIGIISDVANIEFVRVTGAGSSYLAEPEDADLDLQAVLNSNGGVATTWYSGDTILEAVVSIGEQDLEDFGSYAFRTALHEIGHAIGLSHPSEYDGSGASDYASDAAYFEDSAQYTVMSYWDETNTGADFGQGTYSTSVMLHDIAALQRLYGANEATRSDNTIYGFGSNTDDAGWSLEDAQDVFIGAIWDAGGHDTLDLSGYDMDQEIDLREEAFSSTGGRVFNLSIARDVVIEDAAGGSGDDVITGNYAANVLEGGDGDDLIEGGEGDDILFGDEGSDVLFGGEGNDILMGDGGDAGMA